MSKIDEIKKLLSEATMINDGGLKIKYDDGRIVVYSENHTEDVYHEGFSPQAGDWTYDNLNDDDWKAIVSIMNLAPDLIELWEELKTQKVNCIGEYQYTENMDEILTRLEKEDL